MSDEYIPSLTLDPNAAADTAAAEIPTAVDIPPAQEVDVPVEKLELSKFSEAEQAAIRQFATTIDVSNSEQIMNYGAAAQKNISEFSGAALNSVRTKDLGEVGDTLSDLVVQLKSMDFDEKEEKKILEDIKKHSPSILLVGLGAPKQEKWIAEHMRQTGAKLCIGVGGCFDVMSGNVKRAPKVFRRLGLEWFYRLITQPKRWRRMLRLPVFALTVLKER